MIRKIAPLLAALFGMFAVAGGAAWTPGRAAARPVSTAVTVVAQPAAPAPAVPAARPSRPHKAAPAPVRGKPSPPAPSVDCSIASPWQHRTAYADDDCDGTANVCADVDPGAYAEVVARGYGDMNLYCVRTPDGQIVLPPFPLCVTTDASGVQADDYDCDGAPDFFGKHGVRMRYAK